MKKIIVAFLFAVLVAGSFALPHVANALTDEQQNSLEMLLRSFGADDSTIRNFRGAVLGASVGPTDDYGTNSTTSSGMYCPKLTTTLQRGSRDATTGGQVTELQLFLADYFNLNEEDVVSGFFGRLTQKYLADFQKEKGLPSFGIAGSLTRAKISEVCGAGQSAAPATSNANPAGTSPLPGTNVGGSVTDANGLVYSLVLKGSSGAAFVEGRDIGTFELHIKNNSSERRVVTFPNNCWYTYTISDSLGRIAFDLANVQQCISASSQVSKTFTLLPGESFFIDNIVHRFQSAHIPSGSYVLALSLNTQSGKALVAKLEFKVLAREPGGSKLYCTLATDKASYLFGENITVKWNSNGTYATWYKDTEKDNFFLGGDKLAAAGASVFTANVLGNPYLVMKVFDASGNSETCRLVIPVTQSSNPTTPASSSFSVSLDASSPAYKIVSANTPSVHTGSFKFRGGSEDIYLYKVAIIANRSVPGIQKVSLYEGMGDGAAKLGEGFFVGDSASASVIFTRQMLIPKNTEKVIQVRADIGPIGVAEAVSVSGDFIQLNYGNAWGKSGISGADVSPTGSAEVAGIRVMKSVPTVSLDSIPGTALADGRLMRFKVTADSKGAVSLGKMVFRMSASRASVSNVRLYAFSDALYSNPIAGVDSDGGIPTSNVGVFIVNPATPVQIPAGATRYFELRGSVSGISNGASVTTTLLSDQSASFPQTGSSLREKDVNFVWSPNSIQTAGFANTDWFNGFGVRGLPSAGLPYSRTNGAESAGQTNPVIINSFSVSPGTTTRGQSVALSWSSNLSNSDVSVHGGFCYISLLTDQNQQIHVTGGSIGSPSGTVTHWPETSGTYTLHCSSGAKDGSPFATKSVRVTVLDQLGSVAFNGGSFSVPRPTISGTASGLNSFTLVVTGLGDKYAEGILVSGGVWSHTMQTDFPSGTYTTTAYDPKGNVLGSDSFTVSLPAVTVGELHAVGIYEALGSQHNFCYSKPGEATVNLALLAGAKKGTPVTLSLSAYEPVHWKVNVPSGVSLQRVVLSGYNNQSVTVTGASPLVTHHYFLDQSHVSPGSSGQGAFIDDREPNDTRTRTVYNWAGQATCSLTSGSVPVASRWYFNPPVSDYFYAYQKGDSNYANLVAKLQSLTGGSLKSFQGAYSGSNFTVTVGTPEY